MKAKLYREIRADEQRTVILEGVVDAETAWEVVKWLEGLGPEEYPLVLDLSRAQPVHWLAIEILKNGVQALNRKTGPVYLRLKPEATGLHG